MGSLGYQKALGLHMSASQVLKQVRRTSLHHYLTAAGMMSSATAAHLVFPLLAEVALMSEEIIKMA